MSKSFCETKCPHLRSQELRSGGLWGENTDQSICPRRARIHLIDFRNSLPPTGDPVLPGMNLRFLKETSTTDPAVMIASILGPLATNLADEYGVAATQCAQIVEANPDIAEEEVLTISPDDFTEQYSTRLEEMTAQTHQMHRGYFEVN